LQGTALGRLLDRLGVLCKCSYAVAEHKIYLAPREEVQPYRLSCEPPKVLLDLKVLEIPEKRWSALGVAEFLTRFPPPTAEEQEAFKEKVEKTSGVRTFAQASVLIESGTSTDIDFPLEEEAASRTGYFFQIFPVVGEAEWIQLNLIMEFRHLLPSKAKTAPRAGVVVGRPIRANLLAGNRQLMLLQGATWRRKKDSRHFLIALRPTLQEPEPGFAPRSSSGQPRWHLPWHIEVGGEVRVIGLHKSGLPVRTRRIGGEASP